MRLWCGQCLRFGVWCAFVGLASVAGVVVCVVCMRGLAYKTVYKFIVDNLFSFNCLLKVQVCNYSDLIPFNELAGLNVTLNGPTCPQNVRITVMITVMW